MAETSAQRTMKVLIAIANDNSQELVFSEQALKNVAAKHPNFLYENGKLYAIGDIKINLINSGLLENKESK